MALIDDIRHIATPAMTKSRPFPEAITGTAWDVMEGAPRVDLVDNVMHVPMDDDPHSRCLRIHECAHVKWSPHDAKSDVAERNGVGPNTLNAAEDARVNSLATQAGLDMTAGTVPANLLDATMERLLIARDVKTILELAVCTMGTGDEAVVLRWLVSDKANELHPKIPAIVTTLADRAKRIFEQERFRFLGTVRVAQIIEQFAKRATSLQQTQEARKALDADKQQATDANADANANADADENGEEGQQQTQDSDEGKPDKAPTPEDVVEEMLNANEMALYADEHQYGANSEWMPMETIKVPLSCAHKGALRALRPRPQEQGAIMMFPERMFQDGRMFGVRKKTPGVSILIDVSGSMSFGSEELDALLNALPGSTAAVYSNGKLAVVARRGRRIPNDLIDEVNFSGCNGCDGPALEWLGAQRGPRYWISDGCICGTHGASNEMYLEVAEICHRKRITRVPNVLDLPGVKQQGSGASVRERDSGSRLKPIRRRTAYMNDRRQNWSK